MRPGKSKKDECLDHDFPLVAFAFYYNSNKGSTYVFILYYLFIDPRALSSLDEMASDTRIKLQRSPYHSYSSKMG